MSKKLFKCPPTDLRAYTPDDSMKVTYAVSQTYNGGITVGDEWYDGYEVPTPLLAPGYVIQGIGVGLELNAHPPLATGVIKPLSKVPDGELYFGADGISRRKNQPLWREMISLEDKDAAPYLAMIKRLGALKTLRKLVSMVGLDGLQSQDYRTEPYWSNMKTVIETDDGWLMCWDATNDFVNLLRLVP